MDGIPLLLETSPTIEQINLEFAAIESLDPLLPLLSKFPQLKDLKLFANRLETLPADLSELVSLESLDISNNLIENVDSILPSLATLPNLMHLSISLQTENDEENIIKYLPNLVSLNGTTIKRTAKSPGLTESIVKTSLSSDTSFYEDNKKDFSYNSPVSPQVSEKKEFFDQVSAKVAENRKDSVLGQDFVDLVDKIYSEIRTIWVKEDKSKDRRLEEDWEEGLRMVSNELEDILESSSQNPSKLELEKIKSKYSLSAICSKKVVDLIFIKHNIIGGFLCRISEVQEKLFQDLSALTESLIQAKPSNLEVPSKHHSEATPRSARGPSDLEAKYKKEKESMIQRYQEERQELQEEILSLREENKKYLETIIRHSKTYAEAVSFQKAEESRVFKESQNQWRSNGKVLSLRQIKEVIDEIYASKAKYDERCAENHMPRETMEQHMNNYLNKKYGLKSLVVEWGSSIVASIKKYVNKDNDIAVFGKILRNECDEEFRLVQIQVKETVAELLKMGIKNKFPLKNSSDVLEMMTEKMNGYLNEDEWNEIVKYMYNDEDSALLIDEIWKVIKAGQRNNASPPNKARLTREEAVLIREKEKLMKSRVLYNDFLKVLLDFQLRGHEIFLEKFLNLFKVVDFDSDGIINEAEFQDLVSGMDLGFTEEDIDRLLQVIDPYDNQQITFSEAVALFSTELIPVENVAVLKKLSMQ